MTVAPLCLLGSAPEGLAGTFPPEVELSALDGNTGFAVNGINAFDFSGYSISGAGDVNGDGIDDVIISADLAGPNGGFNNGQSYVVFGTDQGLPAQLELSALDGTNGFAINGINPSDISGKSVSGAGDVNGDGIDDVIIGADQADPNGSSSGQSYVVFGTDQGFPAQVELSALDGGNGFAINGIDASDFSGGSVSGAGDVNGDGIDDVIIGATNAEPNGPSSGQSYVVFGTDQVLFPAQVELSALDGGNGFAVNGINAYDGSGKSVSGAGDVNGDGIGDVIIGADGADPSGDRSGQSYVVFGSDQGFPAQVELSALDGGNGFALNGINSSDRSGRSVSGAGDVNGDGIDDVIIGARYADPNGLERGQSYVVFGTDQGFPAQVELSALVGANGFAVNGINSFDRSGWSVSGAGDVNGDGIDDVIIGAIDADPNGSSSGQSYVVFGTDRGFPAQFELSALAGANGFAVNGINPSDFSGRVSGAGDVNGDGIDDVIIGAINADPNGSSSGQSYVVFGGGATPALTVSGLCPGTVTVSLTQATANGPVVLVAARSEGAFTVSAGPCAGARFDLDSPSLLGILPADANGAITTSPQAGAVACGVFLQALDAPTCTPSTVARIPF